MYLNDYTKLSNPPQCGKNTDPNCPSCCPDYANVGSSNIRPNHPDPDTDCPDGCNVRLVPHNPLHTWLIKYAVQGETEKFIGQAYVIAHNIKEAQCIFGTQSCFNGFQERLKITSMFEVPPCPEPVLVQEDSVAIIDRRNLKTYPFLLKSDFLIWKTEVIANLAKTIKDTWNELKNKFKKEVYEGVEGDNWLTMNPTDTTLTITHNESGVTAGSYGEDSDVTTDLVNNRTFKTTQLEIDAAGHITSAEEKTITLPNIKIDTTSTAALTATANESFNNNLIQLHKISKTGTFSDLLNIPDGVLTINYPKGDGTTETKTFTDNADTNETVTIPSEIDDTLAQDYKTYSSNKIEDFVDESIGKGTLIIQKNGTNLPVSYGNNQSKQSFGANDYDACIVNIPVPTKTSDLTNDGSDAQNPNPYINKDASNLTNYYTKTSIDNLLSELEASIDWKEAVATYNDIATTYPNPQDGWTVSTKDTNNVYRYDDTTQTWVNVFSANSNNVEPSTEGVGGHSGLMPATMAEKLNGIEAGAEVNVQPDWNQSTTTADDYIKNKPTIGNGKLTVTINNDPNNKLEFYANQTGDTNFDIQISNIIFRQWQTSE